MKIERSKNATRTTFFGIIQNIYSMLLPFVMRTIIIYVLGMEYLGLNSLFNSVLQVLNLAELGVGSAMVFSMYKPIAEDDHDKIRALMRLYRTYYRIIGLVILVAGLILVPFIPHLIKGNVPDSMNVYVLYLLNLGSTVTTYWLFSYKNCILTAHQRGDISKKVMICTMTVEYALQAAFLFLTKNYYIYVILILLTNILNNIITAIISDKLYPQYHPKGQIPKEEVTTINKKVRDLFTSKVGSLIVDQSDTIVISAFLGLSLLGVYQNYFYILTSIFGFMKIMLSACTAGIGNSLVTETKEKNYNDLRRLTFIMLWATGFCSCCLACLYQPFMELWVGADNMLGFSYVICFCIYLVVRVLNQTLITFKDAGGIWHEDRYRPLIVGLANLCMNLILVRYIGLYGIILSTLLSWILIGLPWLIKNLFTVLFDFGCRGYIVCVVKYLLTIVLTVALSIFVCSYIEFESLIFTMAIRLAVCLLIPNAMFFVLYLRTKEFKGSVQIIDNITKHKIKLLRKFI